MVRRRGQFLAAIPLLLASDVLAQAQDPREIQARKDCLTGKYEAGAALLAELCRNRLDSRGLYIHCVTHGKNMNMGLGRARADAGPARNPGA